MDNATLVGKTREDMHTYYKKEYDRVCTELDNAKMLMSKLKAGIITIERAAKIKELEFAIKVGTLYANKLKVKC